MVRPKSCKLCGTSLKGKRPDAVYCSGYHRLIDSKLRRGVLSTFHAQRLINDYNNHNIMRTKTIVEPNTEVTK